MPTDFESWKIARKAALTAQDGWLNLIARIAMPTGRHTIGSASDCTLQLPSGPAHLGQISHGPDATTFTPTDGAARPFAMSASGFPQLEVPPFLLEVHDPGDDPALRVRDLTLPRDISLDYFDHDPDWIITADWIVLDAPQQIEIGQKGGADTSVTQTHEARFTFQGKDFALVPSHWKAGKPMFVIRDQTSGTETYAASRFLIADDAVGDTITLDFNRVHNPPCAFTEFAICPLPPRSNILPFRLTAGERSP